MLPKKGQAGNAKAKKLNSLNVKWLDGGGEDEVIRFVTSKPDAISVLKQLQDAGIIISNLDELKDQFKKLKLANRRD